MSQPLPHHINRGLLSARVYNDENDNPVAEMLCDCAMTTAVTFDWADLAEALRNNGGQTEVAISCAGCQTVQWITIKGGGFQ